MSTEPLLVGAVFSIPVAGNLRKTCRVINLRTGRAGRIPARPASCLTNVWHTNNWDPIGFPARSRPTGAVAVLVDWTRLPY